MEVKISVIIPCYNQGRFLQQSLDSVMSQTYRNWECIIVNDGSLDDSAAIAIKNTNKDARIKYVYQENSGLSSARNKGLSVATGDFIQFLDADDYISENKFLLSMEDAGHYDVVMSGFRYFTTTDPTPVSPGFELVNDHLNFESLLRDWELVFIFPPHCGIFRRTLFAELKFDETLGAREDWLMWLEIYLSPVSTKLITQPLAFYRVSPDSMSKNRDLMDESLVKAYKIIYKLMPEEKKEMFWNISINGLERLLREQKLALHRTRVSRSYKVGNFLVRNFNKITGGKS